MKKAGSAGPASFFLIFSPDSSSFEFEVVLRPACRALENAGKAMYKVGVSRKYCPGKN